MLVGTSEATMRRRPDGARSNDHGKDAYPTFMMTGVATLPS
jgi:hypothetical protein